MRDGGSKIQSAQPLNIPSQQKFKPRLTAQTSTQVSGGGDLSKIHSLYQDLYLTDLKNDLGEVEGDLSKEKQRNTYLT